MLYQCNPFIGIYTTAREQLLALERRLTPVQVLFTPEMRLVMDYGADRRRETCQRLRKLQPLSRISGQGGIRQPFEICL